MYSVNQLLFYSLLLLPILNFRFEKLKNAIISIGTCFKTHYFKITLILNLKEIITILIVLR